MNEFTKIFNLTKKPPIFEPGEGCIWTDPYIAQQMLMSHLNPKNDAASRKQETIERTIRFWTVRLRF